MKAQNAESLLCYLSCAYPRSNHDISEAGKNRLCGPKKNSFESVITMQKSDNGPDTRTGGGSGAQPRRLTPCT